MKEVEFIYSFTPFELVYKFPCFSSIGLAHPLLSRDFSFKFKMILKLEEGGVTKTQPLPHTPSLSQ
jgi:hypothetical protein